MSKFISMKILAAGYCRTSVLSNSFPISSSTSKDFMDVLGDFTNPIKPYIVLPTFFHFSLLNYNHSCLASLFFWLHVVTPSRHCSLLLTRAISLGNNNMAAKFCHFWVPPLPCSADSNCQSFTIWRAREFLSFFSVTLW